MPRLRPLSLRHFNPTSGQAELATKIGMGLGHKKRLKNLIAPLTRAAPPKLGPQEVHGLFDLFISHNTKDDSHDVFQAVSNFISAYDKKIFNPTTT